MASKKELLEVLNEYKRLGIADQIDYDKFCLYSLITHSTAIEGSTVHPWVDGNGRMSRLVMNHLQFEYGLIPVKVNKEDKAEYIQALINSREHDSMEPFREFMLQEHIKNLRHEMDNFHQSQEGGQKTEKVDRKGGQETRDAILQMIREDAHVSSSKMAERLGINRSAVSKHLKKMQDTGVIRREGPDKGGKWVIIK